MTTATPTPDEIKPPFSLRCFLGSLVATAFWPTVIALVLFVVFATGGAIERYVDSLPDAPEPPRIEKPEPSYEEKLAAKRHFELFKLGAGAAAVIVTILGTSALLTRVSGSYYEKCSAYWTTSDDPTWGGALRAMRDDVRKAFTPTPAEPEEDLVADLVDEYAALDADERERFAVLASATPLPEPPDQSIVDQQPGASG